MFRLGLKLQGQRPRNGKVAPFPSLPWPPPCSSPQGPLPHLGTAVSGYVKGSLSLVSQDHIKLTSYQSDKGSLWGIHALASREKQPFPLPDRLSLSSSGSPPPASVERLGLPGRCPHFLQRWFPQHPWATVPQPQNAGSLFLSWRIWLPIQAHDTHTILWHLIKKKRICTFPSKYIWKSKWKIDILQTSIINIIIKL